MFDDRRLFQGRLEDKNRYIFTVMLRVTGNIVLVLVFEELH